MSTKTSYRSGSGFFSENKFLLLFLAIYIVLSILLFDPKLFTGGDNAVYIILAQSIAEGKGYRDIYLPGEPPHTQYPFGFPLMLSLFLLMFGSEVIIFKLVVLVTGVGSCYFMYRIGQHLFKEKINLIMPFYLSVPIFITYNHWVISEIPYLLFSLGAIHFLIKAQEEKSLFFYMSFIFAIYAFFIRTAGISLILGMVLFLLLKKQYKYCIVLLLLFLAVSIPWHLRNVSVPHEWSYIDQLLAKNPYLVESGRVGFLDLWKRGWNNFVLYFFILPKTLLASIKAPWVFITMGSVFIFLTLIGFINRLKNFTVIELFFVFALVLLLGWPTVWSSERFLLPVLPIFIIYISAGLFWFAKRINSKFVTPVVITFFVLLNAVAIIPRITIAFKDNKKYLQGECYAGYSPDWRHYFKIIEWIKENLPEDKVVMARKPEFVYLLSKRKSFNWPFSTDHDSIKEAIYRSDYVVLDNFNWAGISKRLLEPVLQEEIKNIQFVYLTEEPRFYLIRIVK